MTLKMVLRTSVVSGTPMTVGSGIVDKGAGMNFRNGSSEAPNKILEFR
jgi:hypothetical protein